MSSSPSVTVPDVGLCSPAIVFIAVDFPAPLDPIGATTTRDQEPTGRGQ